jgi:stearoyl-CoA desaturase (delta-9 desaturase)
MSKVEQRRKTGSASSKEATPVDLHIPDNYVEHTLKNSQPLPPITWKNALENINWISTLALTLTPLITIYGFMTVPLQLKTAIFAVFWYFVTGLGITAGYHRLWAHRSYNASVPLQYILAFAGAGAVQGSIKWWSRGHRAHHRYTDTDLDPYGAHHGLLWSHIGWMIFKPRRKPGVADVSDLINNPIVRFQHKYYVWLLLFMSVVLPTVIPGALWGDWRGGYFFAGAARLLFVHHVSVFGLFPFTRNLIAFF